MRVLIVSGTVIPIKLYGGTQRVIWALGKELVKLGHQVTYLVKEGSYCEFASVIYINKSKPLTDQIPENIDVVHYHSISLNLEPTPLPYAITLHRNKNDLLALDRNTIFISQHHAQRYNSDCFVYNGLDWDEYTPPDLRAKRDYYHFLAKASLPFKNLTGAVDVIQQTKSERLKVMGGTQSDLKTEVPLAFSSRVSFSGTVGGKEKDLLINHSKGLIFPVRWQEAFGLAIIESLYYGCPVFGTPYGSLPELITEEVGILSDKKDELAYAIEHSNTFSAQTCHDYALEFNSKKMAKEYIKKYETVISGEYLNQNHPQLKTIEDDELLKWE